MQALADLLQSVRIGMARSPRRIPRPWAMWMGLTCAVAAGWGCRRHEDQAQRWQTPPSDRVLEVTASPTGDLVAVTTESRVPARASVWIVAAEPMRPLPRLVAQGRESFGPPVWRPDGQALIATLLAEDMGGRLYLADTTRASTAEAVAKPPSAWPMYPAWSPDGTRLVWMETNARNETYLSIMEVDTRAVRRLATTRAPGPPAWSPTGRWIAFAGRGDPKGAGEGAEGADAPAQLYVMAPDGTGERAVPNSERLRRWVWGSSQELLCRTTGPDGSQLSIFTLNVLTGGRKALLEGLALPGRWTATDGRPFWDPGHRRLLGTVELPVGDGERVSSGTAVVSVDLAEGTVRQLTTGPADSCPAWMGDGEHIAFVRDDEALWVMATDGSDQRRVLGLRDLR